MGTIFLIVVFVKLKKLFLCIFELYYKMILNPKIYDDDF